MAQSDVDVSNNALLLIGARFITIMAGTEKEAIACNQKLDSARRGVLRMHVWSFAQRRKRLTMTYTAVAGAVTHADGIKITTGAAHGWSVGDHVGITDVVGTTEANGMWYIVSVPAATEFTIDQTFTNAYVSGGNSWLAPQFDYTYQFAIPTGMLRAHRVLSSSGAEIKYRIENNMILTNNDVVQLLYIIDVTDYTAMDTMFYEALAHYLAWSICYQITASSALKDGLWKGLELILRHAKTINAQEDPQMWHDATTWDEARSYNRGQFARDPMT